MPPSRVLAAALLSGLILPLAAPVGRAADDDTAPTAALLDSAAEEDPAPGSPKLYGFHQIGLDAKYLFTRPFNLDRKGRIKVAVTAGTAGALFLLRNRIRDRVQDHRTDGRDQFLDNVRVMGDGGIAPALALVSYGVSFLTHDTREKETAVLLLESMAFTGAGVGLGQFVLSSERPVYGNDVRFFHGGGHGFSGDAGLAASIVPILRRQYLIVKPADGGALRFWKRGAAGLLYTGAILTAYQRVNSDRHWAPDAFLGSVTGFTVGEILCDSHDLTKQGKERRAHLELVPGGIGLGVAF